MRRLLGWYPFYWGTYEVNFVLGKLGFDSEQPLWMQADPQRSVPGMKLDVSDRYQRKNFYFLKAYWQRACAEPFAKYLAQTLTPGGVFLDIGAHLGFHSFQASKLVGDTGRVYAFEPDPLCSHALCESAALNSDRIAVECFAVADEDGVLPFYRTRAMAHSLVPNDGTDRRYTGQRVDVRVTTLDSWSHDRAIELERVQLVKIDVEGAEARTVRGGLEFFERAGRPPLWCEVRGPAGSVRAPNTFVDVLAALSPLGYRAFRWQDGRHAPVGPDGILHQEDVLFLAS